MEVEQVLACLIDREGARRCAPAGALDGELVGARGERADLGPAPLVRVAGDGARSSVSLNEQPRAFGGQPGGLVDLDGQGQRGQQAVVGPGPLPLPQLPGLGEVLHPGDLDGGLVHPRLQRIEGEGAGGVGAAQGGGRAERRRS